MRCPLPIDWLDYLDGAASDELTVHLAQCQPCRLLVGDLERGVADRLPLKVREIDRNRWQHLLEEPSPAPAFGEIRWSAFPIGEGQQATRVLLLLLSDSWLEAGQTWIDALPVTTDIDEATSLDVIFDRKHSELNLPLRLHLKHQLVASSSNVGGRCGRLTEEGVSILREIVAGSFERTRSGSRSDEEGAEPSALSPEWFATIEAISRAYAEVQDTPQVTDSSKVTYIPMVRQKQAPAVREELRLAAASQVGPKGYIWCADIPNDGSVCGKVEHDYKTDELTFIVVHMSGIYAGDRKVIVVLSTDRFPMAVSSQPFVLAPDRRIVLGRELAILPPEIKGLDLGVLK